MRKITLKLFASVMAVIFVFGSFGVCRANIGSAAMAIGMLGTLLRSSKTIRGIKAVDRASGVNDILKMGAALMVADTSELNVYGLEPGISLMKDVNNQWIPERHEANGGLVNWFYQDGTVMVVSNENNVAIGIFCERNPYLKTRRGIHCGSSLQDVIKAYGDQFETVALNDNYNAYVFSVREAVFHYR